ncbi:MAG: protein kinase, partial [Acidobacteriota bacterium]
MSTDDPSDPGPRTTGPEPRVVGPYRLEDVLGRGGMGEVHLAYDQRLDRRVAIKHIHREASRGGTGRERLRREAKAVARLSHPAIVQIFDILEEDDGDWIVMELVDGPTVAHLLKAGPIPVDRAISIARQVAEGLAEAHDKGILHRDLKTENVMVASGGRAKILDFGLAKVLGPTDSDKSLTVVGEVMGTCRSMSPEQAKGLELDPRSDLFSLGTFLYEMLSGDSPFQGPTAVATMTRVCTVELPSLDTVNTTVPRELAALVDRLLAKERDGRPADALSVAAELGQLAETYSTVRESESTWPRVSRGWWLASSDGQTATMPPQTAIGLPPRPRWPLVVGLGGLLIVGMIAGLWVWRAGTASNDPAIPTVRRSVAILGFIDPRARDDLSWVSTALSEMIGAELTRTEQIRLIAGETVAEALDDLGMSERKIPGGGQLGRLRDRLGADIVVEGSFHTDAPPSEALRLVTRLHVQGNATPESLRHDGSHTRILDLANAVGTELRQRLEVVAPATAVAAAAGRPTTIASQRAYYRGLALLRDHDLVGARDALEEAIESEPDLALAHAALAEALSALGYDDRARDEAAEAAQLADPLIREERLFVEARHLEMSQRWTEAIETYRRLVDFAPDDPGYGLRLAQALTKASLPAEAALEIQRLRALGPAIADDPRLDLVEADAACGAEDWAACRRLAKRAAERGQRNGARLQEAHARLLLSQQELRGGDDDATRRAEAEAEEARRLFAAAGDGSGEGEALKQLAAIAYRRGEIEEAQVGFKAALDKFQQIGNRRETAVALNNVAVCQLD